MNSSSALARRSLLALALLCWPLAAAAQDDDLTPRRKHAQPIDGKRRSSPRATPPPAEPGLAVEPGLTEESQAEEQGSEDLGHDVPLVRRAPRAADRSGRAIDPIEETGSLSSLDEPGSGLSLELLGGALLLDGADGGTNGSLGLGVDFVWQLGRLFAAHRGILHDGLFLELSYLHASEAVGTRQVQVHSSYHHLSAALIVGYPVLPGFLLYGKVGPALFLMPVTYDVQTQVTDFLGVKGGVVYGAGARGTLWVSRGLGFTGRLEIARYRRQYLDDTLIGGAMGLAF